MDKYFRLVIYWKSKNDPKVDSVGQIKESIKYISNFVGCEAVLRDIKGTSKVNYDQAEYIISKRRNS